MKRLIYIFGTLFLLSIVSCHESFLEEEVFSSLSTDGYFKTEDDLETGVRGIYAALQGQNFFGTSIIMIAEFPTEYVRGYWSHPLDVYTASSALSSDANQQQIVNLWQDGWNVNNRCNMVINRAKQITVSDQVRTDRLVGEARFLRALSRYYQATIYGTNIPLINDETVSLEDLDVELSNAEEIWGAIISDLEFAEEKLPETDPNGRATSWAASALLAKVYLKRAGYSENPKTGAMEQGDPSNYTLAKTYVDKVIASGLFDLMDNPGDVWGDLQSNEGEVNKEVIFAVKYTAGPDDEGNRWTSRYVGKEFNKKFTPYAWKTMSSTWEFYDTYESGDLRIDERLMRTRKPNNTKNDLPKIWKYVSSADTTGAKEGWNAIGGANFGDDVVLLRYADILLMQTEIDNEINGLNTNSLKGINEVRERAGLNAYTVADVQAMSVINQETPATDKDKLRELLIVERKKELIGEGIGGWFDYVRLNILMRELAKYYEHGTFDPNLDYFKKYHLLPIYIIDIQLNPNLQQNWGWSATE